MPSIKIRNLTSATEPEVVSSNFLAAALDENAGLTKSTRKVTFAQVVTGGLKDGVVPIPIGSLPIATDSSLGVVQVGGNLSITPQGVLSANSYSLPIASGTVLGGIKVGSNLSITPQGVLSANSYSLPIATKQAVGGVQIGSNLSITPQGLLSVDLATLLPSLPIATANSLGMVQVGANLSITPGGVLSAPTPAAAYQLPTASETVLGGIKVGDNLTIDPDGTLNAAASSGGGGGSAVSRVSSGFQRTNCMDAPSVLTGTNGQQWVYTVSYGGTSTGYHMSQFDIDGTFIGHLFPNSAAGNSSSASWPYHHTTGWGASWPQTWIDGGKTGQHDLGYAYMWVKHSNSFLFSMRLSLTTGRPDTSHGADRNNQAAGDYWATEGAYAAGGNAFGDHWNIIGQDAGNMIMAYGFEASGFNHANGTTIYMMSKGTYNAGYGSYNYTGVQKYLPQCTDGLNGSNTGAQHNQTYILVAGINPTSGRVYLHRRGADDVMTVMQLSQANGTGPSRWYRAFHSMLKTAPDQANTGTYKLNYVTQFAIPDAINSAGGNQTVGYQVQFTTPTTANPDAVPTYLTRGGHWGNWNYGGAQVIPWQSSWET